MKRLICKQGAYTDNIGFNNEQIEKYNNFIQERLVDIKDKTFPEYEKLFNGLRKDNRMQHLNYQTLHMLYDKFKGFPVLVDRYFAELSQAVPTVGVTHNLAILKRFINVVIDDLGRGKQLPKSFYTCACKLTAINALEGNLDGFKVLVV